MSETKKLRSRQVRGALIWSSTIRMSDIRFNERKMILRNYILGISTGILGTAMYFADPEPAWYLWILFLAGSALVAFSLDVFLGSLEEHQSRAAWMGLAVFGGPGVVLLSIVLKAGF